MSDPILLGENEDMVGLWQYKELQAELDEAHRLILETIMAMQHHRDMTRPLACTDVALSNLRAFRARFAKSGPSK